ncbi:MAG TPA: alpha-hydroxy-acid oxidizing protein, partial [Parvularculaceae bacterium]|nr:alpha-hydroxy-acid oxidizing protein [Parvularculaceae bacterium]
MPTMRLVPACTSDYRLLAEQCLPRTLFDYIDGGAYSEVTLAANVADFEKIALKQRVLRDVSQIDTHISLFGDNMAMPVALA